MTLSVTFMFYMAPMHICALINLFAFSPINLLQQTQLPILKGKAWTSYIILLQLSLSSPAASNVTSSTQRTSRQEEAKSSHSALFTVTSQKFCLEARIDSTGLSGWGKSRDPDRRKGGPGKGSLSIPRPLYTPSYLSFPWKA